MNPSPVSVVAIARLVSEHYGVALNDLTSHRREASLVKARQVVMYLAHQHTGLSYPRIGARLHASCRHRLDRTCHLVSRLPVSHTNIADRSSESPSRHFRS